MYFTPDPHLSELTNVDRCIQHYTMDLQRYLNDPGLRIREGKLPNYHQMTQRKDFLVGECMAAVKRIVEPYGVVWALTGPQFRGVVMGRFNAIFNRYIQEMFDQYVVPELTYRVKKEYGHEDEG
jgi:hypothetical protein